MGYAKEYLDEAKKILETLSDDEIEKMVDCIVRLRNRGGRLFVLGVGGGAGHASHAVNDFRKICGIESYAPTDNVSELTARVNDEGWDTSYEKWLQGSRLSSKDGILVFSVGGGNEEKKVSLNLVKALRYAQSVGAMITGIVGRDGGLTAKIADQSVVIPSVNAKTVTPHTESFQAVLWHLMVSHPKLQQFDMKWESTK